MPMPLGLVPGHQGIDTQLDPRLDLDLWGMPLMGNLYKLLVLLMLLLGMDLYMDPDLEQHSIGPAYDPYPEGTLDEAVVGKLGPEGMLDKGVVDEWIVLMEKLLLLGLTNA